MSPTKAGSSPSDFAWGSWLLFLVLPVAVALAVPATWPRWALMWLLAFSIYLAVKWLTWWSTSVRDVSFQLQLAYFVAWPGLDAATFLHTDKESVHRPTQAEWFFASVKTLTGILVLYGASTFLPKHQDLLLGWAGMVGIVFSLHFGLFHLLSCYWRSLGVEARPLMQWPLASTSVSEFWGRRWNTAFRDLANRYLFRPLSRRWGVVAGLLIGFLFSGLVHDFVISFPAGAGYGEPTLYFCLQAIGILLERKALSQWPGLQSAWVGSIYTICIVAIPAGLLFHPPFIRNVVLPFMDAIGAI